MEHLSLSDAVQKYVHPGDALQIFCGHSRWTAAAREVCRQFWGTDPGFELQLLVLGNQATLFFHGGLLRRCVSTYMGNSFPTGGPNPIYTRAVQSGEVEAEHWSILTFQQRVEAAARGLPALVTGSLAGTSMAENAGFRQVETDFGSVNLVAPLAPDVALLHAPVADVKGNVAMAGPTMEGLWAGWAARRGAIVTVDRVVEDLSPFANFVQLPAHRVLAVVETPFGAHPGGMYAGPLPAESYGEDLPFFGDIAVAIKGDFDAWAKQWCLEIPDQETYLRRLGPERLVRLKERSDPLSWQIDAENHPIDEGAPVSPQEIVAALSARELEARVAALGADAVMAGAGIANLAAWIAVERSRQAGSDVQLTAEMGLWGYTPTPADPYTFNHRFFSSAEMLTDCSRILGLVVSGPGTRTIGALGGAEVDRFGNINSTVIPGTSFLSGSGGGADVAAAAECIVSIVAHPRRLVEKCAFITSPGRNVSAICTDLGILRKQSDGELYLSEVVAGEGSLVDRVRGVKDACGWDLRVHREVRDTEAPSVKEILALRNYDRERLFLS